MASKVRIAQQAKRILGINVPTQELILFASQAYAYVVKKNWWNNRKDGETGLNGSFIYSFDDNAIALDSGKNLYYSTLPSSFLGDIPHEMGIPHVSFMESYDYPFVRLANGMPGLFQGLQSETLDSRNTFFVENNRIYLPTIKPETADKTLLIKMVVSLQGLSDEEEISIPPDIELEIINMTVQMYQEKQNPQPK